VIYREFDVTVSESGALGKVDRGIHIAVVGCHYSVNEPMIFFVKKNEDKMRGSVKVSDP
jgi:hypothetical protein